MFMLLCCTAPWSLDMNTHSRPDQPPHLRVIALYLFCVVFMFPSSKLTPSIQTKFRYTSHSFSSPPDFLGYSELHILKQI